MSSCTESRIRRRSCAAVTGARVVLVAGVCFALACQPATEAASPPSRAAPADATSPVSGEEGAPSGASPAGVSANPSTADPLNEVPPSPAPAVAWPETPAGRQLRWLFEAFNERGGKLSLDEVNAHFHQIMLDALPLEQLRAQFQAIAGQLAPLRPIEIETNEPDRLVVVASTAGGPVRVPIAVDAEKGTITGIYFRPVEDLAAKPPTSWDDVDARLAKLAPRTQYLVAELQGTDARRSCAPLHQQSAQAELAIGSTFKLYVLSALATEINAGRLAWDTPLTIVEAQKSLPTGKLQDEPAGATVTVREAAKLMISISDNTATDHLLHRIGRERVEAALRASGHDRPALNEPFLSTRELFLLKLDPAAPTQEYLQANAAARRKLLAGLEGHAPTLKDAAGWTEPRHIDSIEWFASASDLCAVMSQLEAQSRAPGGEPLLEILSVNPGTGRAKELFPYVGFKGGSEPGVLNLTWLVKSEAGRWYVVTLGANRTQGSIDLPEAMSVATGMFALLAGE